MTTVRDVVQRAHRRLMLSASGETLSAADASDGLDALNELIYAWPASGVDTLHQGFTLNDRFAFFVPPEALNSTTMDAISYAGLWNATTNTPALASAQGTRGAVYRVGTAGATALDGLNAWAIDDFLVFDGTAWLKGLSSNRHLGATTALLALRIANDFGMQPPAVVAQDANDGWDTLLADFVKVPDASFDRALTRMPSRRWPQSISSIENI